MILIIILYCLFAVVLLALELFFSATWNHYFFEKGINLFKREWKFQKKGNLELNEKSLNDHFYKNEKLRFLLFRRFKRNNLYAFRGRFFQIHLKHSDPSAARGIIYTNGSKLVVVGNISYLMFSLYMSLFGFFLILPIPISEKIIFSIVIFGTLTFLYFKQRSCYNKVGEIISKDFRFKV